MFYRTFLWCKWNWLWWIPSSKLPLKIMFFLSYIRGNIKVPLIHPTVTSFSRDFGRSITRLLQRLCINEMRVWNKFLVNVHQFNVSIKRCIAYCFKHYSIWKLQIFIIKILWYSDYIKTNLASNIILDYIDNVLLEANCPTFDFIVNTNKVWHLK